MRVPLIVYAPLVLLIIGAMVGVWFLKSSRKRRDGNHYLDITGD